MQSNQAEHGKAFAHAGIVASASAVLADLDAAGLLATLIRGEEERREDRADGHESTSKGGRVGTQLQQELDTEAS